MTFTIGNRVRLTVDLTRYHHSLVIGSVGTVIGPGYVRGGFGDCSEVAFAQHQLPVFDKGLELIPQEVYASGLTGTAQRTVDRAFQHIGEYKEQPRLVECIRWALWGLGEEIALTVEQDGGDAEKIRMIYE